MEADEVPADQLPAVDAALLKALLPERLLPLLAEVNVWLLLAWVGSRCTSKQRRLWQQVKQVCLIATGQATQGPG